MQIDKQIFFWFFILILLISSCAQEEKSLEEKVYSEKPDNYFSDQSNTAFLNKKQGVFTFFSKNDYCYLAYSGFPYFRCEKPIDEFSKFTNLFEAGKGLFPFTGELKKEINEFQYDLEDFSEYFIQETSECPKFIINWDRLYHDTRISKLVFFSDIMYSKNHEILHCGFQVFSDNGIEIRVISFSKDNWENIEEILFIEGFVNNYFFVLENKKNTSI